MVHCDYLNSGYLSHRNNLEYAEFDRIACCSDSVRARFVEGAGVDGSKVYAVRNFYDLRAAELAEEDPQVYDEGYINIVIVARLSPEKGVDRAIEALHNAERPDIRYYIIGDGPDKDKLINKTIEYGMTDRVFFLGEQHNSHRYMMNADYLLVPSLHEAAPVVFDEAKTLGLPIISTDTTSAREMLGCSDLICENSLSGIEDTIIPLHKRINLESKPMTNQLQNEQFKQMIGSVSKKEPGDETMEDN